MFLGVLVGLIPFPVGFLVLGQHPGWDWPPVILGPYVGAWVGAVLLWIVSHQQCSRVFAIGMMIGLVAIPICAVGVIIFVVIACGLSGGCRLTG